MNKLKRPNLNTIEALSENSWYEGRDYCRKHLSRTYDPKKHKGCFLCYIDKEGLVKCDYCRFGYRKPDFKKCYHCFQQENRKREGG